RVNRQKRLLSITHPQLEWRVFHRCECQVEETTSIAQAITSPVKADDGRDHYIGHDFLGACWHWDIPDIFGERLSWTPAPENQRPAAFPDHKEHIVRRGPKREP